MKKIIANDALIKWWIPALLVDGCLAYSICRWLISGSGYGFGANVVAFFIWVIAAASIAGGLILDRGYFDKHPMPKGFGLYHIVTEVALITVLSGLGMFWLAASRLAGDVLMQIARHRAPKRA